MTNFSPLQAALAHLDEAIEHARYCDESDISECLRPVRERIRRLCLLPHILETIAMQEYGVQNSGKLPLDPLIQSCYAVVRRLYARGYLLNGVGCVQHGTLDDLRDLLRSLSLEQEIGVLNAKQG